MLLILWKDVRVGAFQGDAVGGLFVLIVAKAGSEMALSPCGGFLQGMYSSGCSGTGLGVVGALALLLKAAMVSATEDVDV